METTFRRNISWSPSFSHTPHSIHQQILPSPYWKYMQQLIRSHSFHCYLTQGPLCLSAGLFKRPIHCTLPSSPYSLFLQSSQGEPLTYVYLHCPQISRWFHISIYQIHHLYHRPWWCLAKVLYDLTTASSLTAFTPHQLLHPPFSASPTLRFLFFQYTSLHKIISSMRVETWAFYKRLHPLNQEQCQAHLYSLSKSRLNERWCFLSLLFHK